MACESPWASASKFRRRAWTPRTIWRRRARVCRTRQPTHERRRAMNRVLLEMLGVTITPWKLVGYTGVALFAGRWFVQLAYSRIHRRPVVPTAFWLMSIFGSLLLL